MSLDFAKLCGKHGAIYEAYYNQMDSKRTGIIEAMAAAKFLKKSGLSDVVLSRVWDLSDPNGKGYLDKPGFFIALKLVSLAQAGQVYNMNNIYMETEKPPKLGDLPKIVPPRPQSIIGGSGPTPLGDWSISVIDRLKYEQLFESLKPVHGMLAGNKVKGVLMDSKLPMETLGKIWDLSDQDKDGNLDKHEFVVAMHLVYQTLEKRTVPDMLPPELRKPRSNIGGGAPTKPAVGPAMPRAPSNEAFNEGGFVANFPKDIPPPPVVTIPSMTRIPPVGGPATVAASISSDPLIPIGAPPSVTANIDWVVTDADLKRYEVMFRESDRDKDGLVSGLEVKNIFLQSGVPQKMLAHIWALCDSNQSGKLTLEQFALAMWFVERKQKGIDPPQVLTASMVPPSMRGIVSGVDLQSQEVKPTYTNPELEMIAKEIEELVKERRTLEAEIAQKEADIRIKSGEVRSLQSELDTLSATLKQLENQRGEAQKRLDDLKAQVNKIREQCQKQEETINEQEGELDTKRSELQKLKDEENSLQKEYDENNRELQKLTNHLQNTQLQISSIRSMVTQLLETQRQMTDALLLCKAAIDAENAELVSEYQLKMEPDFEEARKTVEKEVEEIKSDPFNDNTNNHSTIKTGNGFDTDPFGSKITTTNKVTSSGFDDTFNTGFESGFDAFAATSERFGDQTKDPFNGNTNTNSTAEAGGDGFGSDPFAALHAPTGQGQVLSPNVQSRSGPPPRPESPSPALPPKKAKQPPPRPAPPRPLQAPARPAQPGAATDTFGSSAASGGFADFADFDNKAPTPPPLSNLYNLIKPLSTVSQPTADNSMKSPKLFNANTCVQLSTTSFDKNANICSLSNNDANINESIIDRNNQKTTKTTTMSLTNDKNISKSNSSILNGPIDFKDDPFKDYRYEDPFNIKDPFDDDENKEFPTDPDQVFNNDINNVVDETIPRFKDVSKNTTLESVETFDSNKTNAFNSSEELFKEFSDFNISTTSSQSPKLSATDELKSLKATDALKTKIDFANFANFDAFSTKSTSSMDSNNRVNELTTNDPFFANFNDNIPKKLNPFGKQENNHIKSLGVSDAFSNNGKSPTHDAFGDHFNDNDNGKIQPSTNSNSNMFDVFDDNTFEDNFLQACDRNALNVINNNINNNNNETGTNNLHNKDNNILLKLQENNILSDTNLNSTQQSFKHKEFGNSLVRVQNQTILNKVSNINKNPLDINDDAAAAAAKLTEKFSEDYSKADTFEDDIQEAIKRSMSDQ